MQYQAVYHLSGKPGGHSTSKLLLWERVIMGKSLSLKLRTSARATLSRALRVDYIRLTLLRVIYEVLYGQSYTSTRQDFIKMISGTRLHITEPSRDADFEVTFINNGAITPDLNKDLLELAELSARGLLEYSQSLDQYLVNGSATDNDTLNRSNLYLRHSAFAQIPELRQSNNHYILLLVIAEVLKASRVVEVGTASGSSLCSFLSAPNVDHVTTFDVVPLSSNRSWLPPASLLMVDKWLEDNNGRWTQHVVDLSHESEWLEHKHTFANADIIFVDADHSGLLETILSERFETVLKPNTLVIWDDIRVSSMVNFWEGLHMHKLDLTGLGHVTGTGVSKLIRRD